MSDYETKVKVAVITALREELTYLLEKQDLSWNQQPNLPGGYPYHLGTLEKKGKKVQIAALSQPLDDMGLIDAAMLAALTLFALKPEYLVMIGICGGVDGRVNFGDIIVPRQSFHYEHGKRRGDGTFSPSLVVKDADRETASAIVNFLEDRNQNTLTKIKMEAVSKNLIVPSNIINCHYEDIASADVVLDYSKRIDDVRNAINRKVIAFEMESLAVLKAADLFKRETKAVIIKSVSDIPTATSSRDTQRKYRDFAKFAATEAFYKFATETDFFFNLDRNIAELSAEESVTSVVSQNSIEDIQILSESNGQENNATPRPININYTELNKYLVAKRWKGADRETARVMYQATNYPTTDSLTVTDIQNFPQEVLRDIDQLWVQSSNNIFGFSVQSKIYINELNARRDFNEEIWKNFGMRIGWRDYIDWLRYDQLQYSLQDDQDRPLRGHLPRLVTWNQNDGKFFKNLFHALLWRVHDLNNNRLSKG